MIGDVMTTRWAYEAIAVEQFRSGKYMKPYFKTEMMISQLRLAVIVPHTRTEEEEQGMCLGMAANLSSGEAYEGNIEKLNYHIAILSKEAGLDPSDCNEGDRQGAVHL